MKTNQPGRIAASDDADFESCLRLLYHRWTHVASLCVKYCQEFHSEDFSSTYELTAFFTSLDVSPESSHDHRLDVAKILPRSTILSLISRSRFTKKADACWLVVSSWLVDAADTISVTHFDALHSLIKNEYCCDLKAFKANLYLFR